MKPNPFSFPLACILSLGLATSAFALEETPELTDSLDTNFSQEPNLDTPSTESSQEDPPDPLEEEPPVNPEEHPEGYPEESPEEHEEGNPEIPPEPNPEDSNLDDFIIPPNIADLFPERHQSIDYPDVLPEDWYYNVATLCTQTGLMQGTAEGFAPSGTLTVSQIATIAARMAHIIQGGDGVITAEGDLLHWYDPYVNFLTQEAQNQEGELVDLVLGILAEPTQIATLEDVVRLLSFVLPEEYLTPINEVEGFVQTQDPYALAFFEAGIFVGYDSYTPPDMTLYRSQTATILTRIIRPDQRITLEPPKEEDLAWELMGITDSSIFLTLDDTPVLVGDALPHLVTAIDELIYLCSTYVDENGNPVVFDWGHTVQGVPFADYILNFATEEASFYAWVGNQTPNTILSKNSKEILTRDDPTFYASNGYTKTSRTQYLLAQDQLQAQMATYPATEEDRAAWITQNQAMQTRYIRVNDSTIAQELYDQLQQDATLFPSLMASHSQDNLASQGYLFLFGDTPSQVEMTTSTLVENEISAPIASEESYYIIQRLPVDLSEATYQYNQTLADYALYKTTAILEMGEVSSTHLQTLYENLMALRGELSYEKEPTQ